MKKIIIILCFFLLIGCGKKVEYQNIDVKEIDALLKEHAFLLDVRSELEFSHGHIENATNIDVEKLEQNVEDLIPNKERKIIVYCQSGNRSVRASEILIKLGYQNVYNVVGGYGAYQNEVK